jgi:SpoVK/Ycf46/Vps4 family AAA+-type ATPase
MMPAILMTGPEGVGKRTIAMATGRQLGLLTMNINCYDLIGDSVAATETRIGNAFQKGFLILSFNFHFQESVQGLLKSR